MRVKLRLVGREHGGYRDTGREGERERERERERREMR